MRRSIRLSRLSRRLPLTLQVDASKHGLGVTLLQEGKLVAFASKSLTSTEVNYAQIEKETYAILFARGFILTFIRLPSKG